MELPQIPSVAIGAIVAAVLGGIITLVGLIISKEQKTSEFRQAWIDALRVDISNYITNTNAILDALAIKYESYEKKVEALSPLYTVLNASVFNIMLRVNPTEPNSVAVLDDLSAINALVRSEKGLTSEALRPLEARLLSSSQVLLKSEWDRVKDGEPTFKITKWFALAMVAIAIGAAATTVITATSTKPGPSQKAVAHTTPIARPTSSGGASPAPCPSRAQTGNQPCH